MGGCKGGRIPLLQQLGGMGERCKLPHRSPRRSPNIPNDHSFYRPPSRTYYIHDTCTCMYRLWTVLYQYASCTERSQYYNPCTIKGRGTQKKLGEGALAYGPAIGAKLFN